MANKRHWSDFPISLIETVQKFEEAPNDRLALNGLSRSDAYGMRNEFHRFRRAVIDAVHYGRENEQDLALNELYSALRDMSLSLRPLGTSNLYQLVYTKHVASRYLDKWEAFEPLVDTEEQQV
jgi:hypothetical protein